MNLYESLRNNLKEEKIVNQWNAVSDMVSTDLVNAYIEDINNCKSLDELKRTVRKIFKDDRVDDIDYDWLMDNTILEKFKDLGFTFPEDESTYEVITHEVDNYFRNLKETEFTDIDSIDVSIKANIDKAISDYNNVGGDITFNFESYDDDFNRLTVRAFAVGPDSESLERDVMLKLDGVSTDAIYEALDTWATDHNSPDNFYEAEGQKDNDRLYNDFMQLVGKYSNDELGKLAKDLQEYVINDEGVEDSKNKVRVSNEGLKDYLHYDNLADVTINPKNKTITFKTVKADKDNDGYLCATSDFLNIVEEYFRDQAGQIIEVDGEGTSAKDGGAFVLSYRDKGNIYESESSSNKYAYLAHVLNFLNNTAPGGISDGEIRVLADAMYNIDTGKGELPREESTFVVTPEQREEVTAAIETDDLQRFLGVINNIVVDNSVDNSEEAIKEAAGPEIPAYYGDPNDDPDWHPESKRNEKPEQEVIYFKEKNRPEPTGEVVTTQDLNYPGVTFETTNDEHLYVRAWWSDNGALDDEERDEWEDPDDVWGIYYTIYNAKGEEVDGGIMYDYDYGKWSASELANNLLSMSGYTKNYDIKVSPLEEVEDLLEESQTQEIEGIISDMVKKNPKAEDYLNEYYAYIDTLEPAKDDKADSGEVSQEWEDWYKNTANVLYNPTAWNKFIEWAKEKYGEDAVKGLNESEDLKSFKFKVYTESDITNGKATRLADTVSTLKEAEDLIQSYRKQNLKAHCKVEKD